MKTVNGNDFERWHLLAGFGIVDTYYYKCRRLPLPEDIKQKRREHMQKLYNEGAPYSWIAQRYKLDRAQVRRIINELPNNP